MPESRPLVCPRCASTFPLADRFCARCGMPLVYSGQAVSSAPITEQHVRARKIKPQYTEGDLIKVAGASNQAEAEFIQGMLLEEGVPSLLRRAAGFDVPDYMAGGRRDVLVPASGVDTAREVLLEAELIPDRLAATTATPPIRVLAGLLLAVAIVGVVLSLVTHIWG